MKSTVAYVIFLIALLAIYYYYIQWEKKRRVEYYDKKLSLIDSNSVHLKNLNDKFDRLNQSINSYRSDIIKHKEVIKDVKSDLKIIKKPIKKQNIKHTKSKKK